MIPISDLTRKNLEDVPLRRWDEDVGCFDSIILIPMKKLHEDSGFTLITLVGCRDGQAVQRLSDCSDVIRFLGVGYKCECFPKSRFLQFWVSRKQLRVSNALISIEIQVI